MNEKKFIPKGKLEAAVAENQNEEIIRLIAEGERLRRPVILATDEFYALPVRTAAVVIECGINGLMRQKALSFVRRHHLEYVIGLMDDVRSVPKTEPEMDDEELMRAVTDGNDRKICRLVEEDGSCLRSLTPERCAVLCRNLLNLEKYTIVLLLAEGIHYASVPAVLNFLLQECEQASLVSEMDYKERLMLANLLVHILQGEITPDNDELVAQDWYPMGSSIEDDDCDRHVYCRPYSYYYDPQHIYRPRFADGEYEQPKHSIR